MTFTYDINTARFRTRDGRFISAAEAKRRIEKKVTALEKQFRQTAKLFNNGKITLAEFQMRMAARVKSSVVSTAAIGRGGRKQMNQSDWGKVGVHIREQNKYLNRLARGIENGTISANQLEYRASLYARQMRTAFSETQATANKDAGRTLCKRVIYAMESCSACLDWSKRGFVAISEQPAIGSLTCLANCRCDLIYK